jgi:hypothetical protein
MEANRLLFIEGLVIKMRFSEPTDFECKAFGEIPEHSSCRNKWNNLPYRLQQRPYDVEDQKSAEYWPQLPLGGSKLVAGLG